MILLKSEKHLDCKGEVTTKKSDILYDMERSRRELAVQLLQENATEENLWNTVVEFQDYPFHTVTGLPFQYSIKVSAGGSYTKELLINRRKNSKTLTWSSVRIAFQKALLMQGQVIDRPKALGDIRGISYIYPMMYHFGLILVSDKVAENI